MPSGRGCDAALDHIVSPVDGRQGQTPDQDLFAGSDGEPQSVQSDPWSVAGPLQEGWEGCFEELAFAWHAASDPFQRDGAWGGCGQGRDGQGNLAPVPNGNPGAVGESNGGNATGKRAQLTGLDPFKTTVRRHSTRVKLRGWESFPSEPEVRVGLGDFDPGQGAERGNGGCLRERNRDGPRMFHERGGLDAAGVFNLGQIEVTCC